jgi:hypothetical protein
MMRRLCYYIGVAALIGSGTAWADTALQSGVAATLSLPASTYVSNYYIDVDNTAKQLRINVAASGGDVDLFVRYGSPFPTQNAQASYPTVSEDLLNRYAHYHSVSSTSNEAILIGPSSRVPLQAGRWYVAVINGGTASANGTLTAITGTVPAPGSIALDFANPRTDPSNPDNDCDDSFWTDTTPMLPVGNNPGTTLGEQRKNALTFATQQLVQQLQTSASVTVHACGAHLGGDANSAILAHAAPLAYFFDEPQYPINSLDKKYTWYPAAAIVNRNGTSQCGFAGGPCDGVDNEEIEITFNEDIGKSSVIAGENFYLGYTSDPSPHSIDFITVAMHEMTHGLGFFGLANTDATLGPLGAKAGINTTQNAIVYENIDDGPYDDIYDDSVAIVNGTTYTPFFGYEVNGSGDAARAAALVSGATVTDAGTYIPGLSCSGYTGPCTGLRWLDAVAADASVNDNVGRAAPNDFPSLYAPCDESSTATCATQPASTLSHTVQSGDMMNAYYTSTTFNLRQIGLAAPMLAPVGWPTAAATAPVYGEPIPSAWYDQTHSGHGFDFQLAYHDAVNGDVYILTLYTYTSTGVPEWYEGAGHVVDGVFLPELDANGNTLSRVVYHTTPTQIGPYSADSSVNGSVVVDFNQAANAPACRNLDRSGADRLAVMYWNIAGDSGSWCVQPIVPLSAHAAPDYNGLWYPPTDPGWGFELLDVQQESGNPLINLLIYLPGPNDRVNWVTGSGALDGNTVTIPLQQVTNGYCRTCPPPAALQGTAVGTITLVFDPPNPARGFTTGNATISVNYPGGGSFARTSIPISMLSTPTGQ